jgi:hypothetical protein
LRIFSSPETPQNLAIRFYLMQCLLGSCSVGVRLS